MRHLALGSLVIGVIVAVTVLAFSARGQGDVAHAGPGDVTLVAIDMDTIGNDDTSVGFIENCAVIPHVGTHNQNPPAAGTTHTFDLVVKGVDPADKIRGYQFDIDYDATVIEIIGAIAVDGTPTDELLGGRADGTVTMISRIDTWGGAGFIDTSESAAPVANLADDDGSFTVAAADGTDSIASGTQPPDGHESGDGVLARITVRSVGTGQSPLLIPSVDGGADGNPDAIIVAGNGPLFGDPIPITTVQQAAVSVGEPCVPPTPTPTPGPTPTPTSTPTPTPTPPPATPTPSPPSGPTPTPIQGGGPGFNPCSIYGLSDSSPGANADTGLTVGIGIGDDCQAIPVGPNDPPDLYFDFGATLNFTPPEWGVARDADIADGAYVADLSALATVGLIGNACSNMIYPNFNMMDATTDMSVTVPFYDPEFQFDPPDTNDTQGAEPDDQFDTGPDGLPLGVTRYPDYLTRIFKDNVGNTLTPIARMYGQTVVAKAEVSLQYLTFEPGTVFRTPAGEMIVTDPRLGYPSVIVLANFGDPVGEATLSANNIISDLCSPLQIDATIFGVSRDNPNTAADEGGHAVRTNPPDGSYNPLTYAVSKRDNDEDGIENSMDPCPYNANPNWDPRMIPGNPISPNPNYTGDDDLDGLPNECDPDPNQASPVSGGVHDEDGDLYANRADNCPLVANSAGQNGGIAEPPAAADDNQDDADLDGIGDACDDKPNVADGWRGEACLVSEVTIGAGGPAPDPPQNMQPCAPYGPPVIEEPPPAPEPTPTPTPPPGPTCNGLPATIVGTERHNLIFGTRGDDVIVAMGGHDIIFGRGGDDTICAGDGRDTVFGGRGDDTLYGEKGKDHLFGGRGNDYLDGGPNRDLCNGGRGSDSAAACEKEVRIP